MSMNCALSPALTLSHSRILDNGKVFTARRFRAACRDYRLSQEFITPYTPEQNGTIERSSVRSRRSASGSTTSSASSRHELRSPAGSAGTTSVVPIRRSAS